MDLLHPGTLRILQRRRAGRSPHLQLCFYSLCISHMRDMWIMTGLITPTRRLCLCCDRMSRVSHAVRDDECSSVSAPL